MLRKVPTFAHSGTVVNDKGSNIFIIGHLGLVVFDLIECDSERSLLVL